ncbi:MAG: hypothetical protein CM1200mP28_18370 [Deltaproteobacteria bacterium]|nr:MAG: hypothetical protein CM1200mP28_18370 [Deltaproteobacteria bacterium]
MGRSWVCVFSGSPALGLPPEPPGMTAAALESRQIWWVGTVMATATGIGLLIESKTILLKIIAVVLIAVPHIIGAPHPHVFESNVPAELSAQFAVASLLTSVFFGWCWGRYPVFLSKTGFGKLPPSGNSYCLISH